MMLTGADEAPTGLEARILAASTAQTLRYRAVYEQQLVIHRELVAEAGCLAAEIEARLTPRRPRTPQPDTP